MVKLRPRILIVEDEWLLAEIVEETVRDFGFDVAGPVPSVSLANSLVQEGGISAAILDVSLGDGEKSYPVARALIEKNVPFLFITGYLGTDLPSEFRNRPLLSKPLRAHVLRTHLESLLAQ